MIRFRNLFLLVGSVLVMAVLMATDPDEGLLTGFWALSIAKGIVAVAFAHLARKSLADYPEADMRTLFRLARGSATGAGLALIAQAIIILGLLFLFGGNARANVVSPLPTQAATYLPLLKAEQVRWWVDHPWPPMLGGMVEQETCPSLNHSKCWSPLARLKTQREEGAGLGQLTRTWRKDGTQRFDALAELRDLHPALRELSWATIYQRPDLQLRALVLKSRDDFRALGQIRSIANRLVFQVAAYNRGRGAVQDERRLCQVTPECDPQLWWGHVEHTCTASRAPIYSGRSACDINRSHVQRVVEVRAPRYRGWL